MKCFADGKERANTEEKRTRARERKEMKIHYKRIEEREEHMRWKQMIVQSTRKKLELIGLTLDWFWYITVYVLAVFQTASTKQYCNFVKLHNSISKKWFKQSVYVG